MPHRNFRFNMSKTEITNILTKITPHPKFPLSGPMFLPTQLRKLEIWKSTQTVISYVSTSPSSQSPNLPYLLLETLRSISLYLQCLYSCQVLVFILTCGLVNYNLQTKSILPLFLESPICESFNRTQQSSFVYILSIVFIPKWQS